ncbi:hypothetical protein B0J11DRAFT_527389 [Dendryphion nanum]|uniref:Enoyl reductase (ER) domain-containing protein n=1 Tax=Dendryphion nanum TaxID=256645 RepID=A0A9P9DXU0_9PLEO|nr:hypothetical protein B0J11DRAFT_527389 [Dendryphion nanum]
MTSTMKAWQFTSAAGGLENNLFQPASGTPKPKITPTQVLVEVHSASINPADHKVPELGLIAKAVVPSPSIPGFDFCGRIVEKGEGVDGFSVDQMVFGSCIGRLGKGSLAEYISVDKEMIAAKPDEVTVDGAASCGVVGITALQTLKSNVKEGNHVFVNGGSGGTGVWTIQIAKALGCRVTTSCSEANIGLCKSLGADEVLDYKSRDIVEQLTEKGQVFDLIVDNIGTPANLYSSSHLILKPTGKFMQIGAPLGLASGISLMSRFIRPGFLGGGKRPFHLVLAKVHGEDFAQLATWFKDGKVKPVIDSVFEFDEVPKAFEKLKTGRAKGKIVVRVKKQ